MTVYAIDFGTSGAKRSDGRTVEYPTHYPAPGHVEQHPSDWFHAFEKLFVPDAEAMVLTGQMQDLIYLDRDDDTAVLYSDTRSRVPAIDGWEDISGNLQGPTSNVAMMYTLGPGRVVFSPFGYIAHRLGLGEYVDPTTASTTGFLDLRTRMWSDTVCSAIGVDADRHLPTIAEGQIGTYRGVDIILAPGDAATTALGIGTEHIYLGTTGWHAQITQAVAEHRPEKHTLALGDDRFLSIAAIQAAGSARDEALRLFPVDGSLPAGPSGVVALPTFFGERYPRRVETPGAAFLGVTPQTTTAHLHKAILEGVCIALSFDVDPTGEPLAAVGGCTRSPEWMQILADVTGRTIEVLPDFDAGTVGALRFAGVDIPTPAPSAVYHPQSSYEDEKARFMAVLGIL